MNELASIKKRNYDLIFPLDFAGTLCARDGIKTGPHSPNGEDAYDRKLVVMKRKIKKPEGTHYYYHHKCTCDVREVCVCPCMGAERNTNPSNDNPLIVTCFSSTQDHCVIRGPFIIEHKEVKMPRRTYNRPRNEMFVEDDVAQCLGASHNMSPLNNRIIVAECIKRGFGRTNNPPNVYGLDQQGGKGGANYTENIAPTICSDSHGTPHGVCVTMQGSKNGV